MALNYITPKAALEDGSDILIVGRGIYQAKNIEETAEQYRRTGIDISRLLALSVIRDRNVPIPLTSDDNALQ